MCLDNLVTVPTSSSLSFNSFRAASGPQGAGADGPHLFSFSFVLPSRRVQLLDDGALELAALA